VYTYRPTITFESQVFPGVSFTLRKMSEARRAEFTLATSDMQSRLLALTRESSALLESLPQGAEVIAPDAAATIEDLHVKVTSLIAQELNPAYVRWGLKCIAGLDLEDDEGNSAALTTAEALIADGPPELFAEICGAVRSASSMTEAELKNFVLPTIFGVQTAGSAPNSSALNVSDAGTSEAGTVADTSPI